MNNLHSKQKQNSPNFTFSGFMQGALSWMIWMPVTLGVIIGISMLLGEASEGLEIIFIIILFLLPIFLSLWTGRLISDFQQNKLSQTQRARFIKARKTLITFSISLFMVFFIMIQSEYHSNDDTEFFMMVIGLPSLITLLIVFISPLLYKGILAIIDSKKSQRRIPSFNPQAAQRYLPENKKSKSSKGRWVLNKVVAPVLVGVILGFITFALTGEFNTGGGVSLISASVTLVLG